MYFTSSRPILTVASCAMLFVIFGRVTSQATGSACDSHSQQLLTFVNAWCPPQQQIPPRTCADVQTGSPRQITVLESGLEVLCDTETDNGGWIVFQRRTSADEDFYRTWKEYKYGFGDLGGNFWFGNENIHQLTFQRRYELRVDIVFNNSIYYATYDRFSLTGEDDKYRLRLGSYSGNSSDALDYHKDRQFTTKDSDNDVHSGNCAQQFHGAWWYGGCHNSNLNGLWGSNDYAKGLTWHTTTGDYANPTFTEMKIRPITA